MLFSRTYASGNNSQGVAFDSLPLPSIQRNLNKLLNRYFSKPIKAKALESADKLNNQEIRDLIEGKTLFIEIES